MWNRFSGDTKVEILIIFFLFFLGGVSGTFVGLLCTKLFFFFWCGFYITMMTVYCKISFPITISGILRDMNRIGQ